MFDLNELPDTDGPSGMFLHLSAVRRRGRERAGGGAAAAPKEEEREHVDVLLGGRVRDDEVDDEMEEDEEEEDLEGDGRGFYPGENSRRIVSRFVDDEDDSIKERAQSFLRLDSDWQRFDESEADPENAVTVAALDSRVLTGLDTAVSLVMPTEPRSSFGISPGPEKLGQRTEKSRKQQLDFTKFHRPPGNRDTLVSQKRAIGRLEEELSLDYRRSPGIVSGKKGKRAREEAKESSVDPMIRLKRYGIPTSSLAVSENEAGPSLSMSLDQSAAAAISKKAPLYAASKASSRGRGFERDASAALSLGEPTRKNFVATKAMQSQSVRPALGLTSKTISGTTRASNGKAKAVIGAENNLDLVSNSDDDLEVQHNRMEKKTLSRGEMPVIPKEPFWQGKLYVQGFRPTDVAAYCSEDVQPASKLRSLPKVITIESLLSIEDFLAAIRGANVIEPLLQLRLQPDAFSNGQSFSSMVTSLNLKKIGAGDRSVATETKPKRQNELHAWRNGPMASAGANNVFVANLKLRQSKESFRGRSAILYLVLGSSYRTISENDLQIGKKLLEALNWSSFLGDENSLFGFLCASENAGRDAGRFADTSRGINSEADELSSDIEPTTTKRDSHRGTPEFHSTKVDVDTNIAVSNSLSYRELPSEVGFVTTSPSYEERRVTGGNRPTTSISLQKEHAIDGGHDARYSQKGRGRKEEYNARHNSSLMDIEHYREKDRPRDRDRDNRYTEDDRDFRNTRRYQHRSSERSDLSKQERSKERELERYRERSRRDSQRESMERSMERSKGSRDRMRDQEKGKYSDRHWDRHKEKERERTSRRRDRSAESDRENMMYALESEKALSMSGYEGSHGHSLQSPHAGVRKRSRIGSEDSSILVSNPNGGLSVQPLNQEGKLNRDVVIRVDHVVQGETPLETGQGEANVTAEPSSRADADTSEEKLKKYGNVLRADARDAGDARSDELDDMTNGELVTGHKQKIIYTRWPSSTHSSNKSVRALSSVNDAIVVGTNVLEDSAVAVVSDSPLISQTGARIAKETTLEEGVLDREDLINDARESGKASGDDDIPDEPPGYEGRVRERKGNAPSDLSGGVPGLYRNVGEQGKIEDRVTESTLYVADRRTSEGDMLRNGNQSTSKPVQVENKVHTSEVPKPDENEAVNEARESSPGKPVEGANAIPSTEISKTVASGADDSQGNLESPSTENGLSLSTELRHEIVLEGCNKDTRVWLTSKQSASYLSEEFGVRIFKVEEAEEVASAKPDSRLNTERGPLHMRVYLAAETPSTATSEAKWFINFAADVLKALAARGVLAKYLWYQGQVQRYTSDEAPSISVVVKKIKGEDGKNLERIQEGTGVMIGIVHTKKETVDHGRVIGLRLNGTKQKGFQAAIVQVEHLLSQVAEQFSTSKQATLTQSQDPSLSKLKLDFPSQTVLSPGIVTPMVKDVSAAYSPVSPVTNESPLESIKNKVDDPSTEMTYSTIAPQITASPPVSIPKTKAPAAPAGDSPSPAQQSEDEQPENEPTIPDPEAKCSRPLLVSNIPEKASAQMLRTLFEDVLVNVGLTSNYDGVIEIRLAPEKYSAYVEFASDELLYDVLKLYANDKSYFFDLNLELGPVASQSKSERMYLPSHTESPAKGLDYDSSMADALTLRSRHRRESQKSDQHGNSSLHGDTESDGEAMNDDRQLGGHDGDLRYQRLAPTPLFLTELIRNASARTIYQLFEDIVTKFIHHSVGKYQGRDPVRHVRYIQSRGCAFVDLATSELVDCMIKLHMQRPEVFFHMTMDIAQRPVPLGHGLEEPVIKRAGHSNRSHLVEEFHGYGSHGRRSRGYFRSSTPPLSRENEMAMIDHDYMDDYDENEDDDRHPTAAASRKRRSDPERTVYADRLPENASDSSIRRIFERVLRDHMTDDMRRNLGDHTIAEVRHVPTKFCAFVVFAAEELTRLVLQLYNQDEEIFQSMRLKPHFHSRMEDLYRDDPRDREDGPPAHRGPHSGRALSVSSDRRRLRGGDDYHSGYSTAEMNDYGYRVSRSSAAHRAVAATAFKEVDRRRSVYVDRVTEKLPEPKMREVFEEALRQRHRRGYGHPLVSQVTFFRDKFSPEKLCAFVELNSEELVQKLLDIYKDDEEAFQGMRVRPAVKYGNS